MTPRGPLPMLDETRCTGCAACIAICPVQCLAKRGPVPWLPKPLLCVSCSACERICPESAISFAIAPAPAA
jgi:ferredoxin